MSNELIYTLIGEAELPQIEQFWVEGISDEVFAPFFACLIANLADDEMSAWYRNFVQATDTAYGTAIATGSPLVGGQVYWHNAYHTKLAEQIAQTTSADKAFLQVAFPLATHAGYDYLAEQADLAGVSLQEYAKSKLPGIATALPAWAEGCVPFGVLSQVSVDSLVNKALQSDLGIASTSLDDDVFLVEHLEIPNDDDFVADAPAPQAVELDEIELSPDDFILDPVEPPLPSLRSDVPVNTVLSAMDLAMGQTISEMTDAVPSKVQSPPAPLTPTPVSTEKPKTKILPEAFEKLKTNAKDVPMPAPKEHDDVLNELVLDFSELELNDLQSTKASKTDLLVEGSGQPTDVPQKVGVATPKLPSGESTTSQNSVKDEQTQHRQAEARAFAVLDTPMPSPNPIPSDLPILDADLVAELDSLFDNHTSSKTKPTPAPMVDDVLALDPHELDPITPSPHLEALILNKKEKVRVTAQLEATKSQMLDELSQQRDEQVLESLPPVSEVADNVPAPDLPMPSDSGDPADKHDTTAPTDEEMNHEKDFHPTSRLVDTKAERAKNKKAPKVKSSGNNNALKVALPVALLLLLAGGGGFWYYQNHLNAPAPEPAPVAVVAETPPPPLPVQSLPPSNLSLTVDDVGNLYACRAELGNDGLMQQVYGLLQANFANTVCAMDINAGVSQNMTGLEKLTSAIGLLKTSPFASLELIGDTLYIHSPNPDEITRLVNDMGALMAGVVQVVARPPLNASAEISQSLEKANTALNNLAQNADAHQLARAMSLPIFDLSGGAVPENLMPFLSLSAERLKAKSDIRLIIVVHSDDTGDKAQARQATKQQAELIKKALVGMGVTDFQLVAQGVGYDFPLMDNQTELGRFKNRRVEFLVYDDAVFNALNAPAVPPSAPMVDSTPVGEPMPEQNLPQDVEMLPPQSVPTPAEPMAMPSVPIPPAYDVVGGQIVEQGLPQVNPYPLPPAQFAPIREEAPPPASGDIDDDLLRPIGSDMGNGMATPVQ